MRSKLINFLEDVSQKVANVDQLGKTASVLSGITKVKAEVTQNSKVGLNRLCLVDMFSSSSFRATVYFLNKIFRDD